ncbi:MAG: tRNA (guanosine(37)-N1)-methyltransferase TrmD [bacterium]|nr:tRNA (guanosine(37)-N1)-methyltransferase TrmD [bacterium]
MRFDVITIFPRLFKPFQEESLIQRALKKGLFSIVVHNLRDFTKDKHKSVDDKPFGGGLGMVMKVDPWYRALKSLKKKKKSKTILFTPRGKKFTQNMAHEFSKLDQLVFVCGRYEGIDERVADHLVDEEVSLGDFVLMGGEVAAMAVIESVSRLIPGVVGKPRFLQERLAKGKGRGGKGFLEYPQYTRPEVFEPKKGVRWKVPSVLLSGDHKKIEEWKRKQGRVIGK